MGREPCRYGQGTFQTEGVANARALRQAGPPFCNTAGEMARREAVGVSVRAGRVCPAVRRTLAFALLNMEAASESGARLRPLLPEAGVTLAALWGTG